MSYRIKSQLPLWLGILAAFMVLIDSTIVDVALPHIAQDFHARQADVEWVVNTYTLSFAAILLGAGAFADAIGAKKVFLWGIFIFAVSSGTCAYAGSMMFLNISRLIQGIGAALILPSSLIVATQSVKNEEQRHKIVGYYAAAGGLGLSVGPLLGGVLIQIQGWPLIFWINVILGIIALLAGFIVIPSILGHARKIDFPGQITATVAIAGLIFTCIEAPVRGWTDPVVIIAIILTLLGIIGFIPVEHRISYPLLPTAIYRHKGFMGAVLQGAIFNFFYFGLLFGLSFFLQKQLHLDAWNAGLAFIPLNGAGFLANTQAAKIAQRLGRLPVLFCSLIGLVIASCGAGYAGYTNHFIGLLICLACIGLFAGLALPAMILQILSTVDNSLHGATSAAFNTARQIGGAIGVAVYGPLLATGIDLRYGFLLCMLIGAVVTVISVILTKTTQKLFSESERILIDI